MNSIELSINVPGLHRALFPNEKDFCFIVGNNCYHVSRSLTHFFSPKLYELHQADSATDEYIVQTPGAERYFTEILSLYQGHVLTVDRDRFAVFTSLAKELENPELYDLIMSHFSPSHTPQDILKKVAFLPDYRLSDSDVEFLSSHYHELSAQILNELSLDHIHHIISHPSLKLEN
jgi:hypothetical protein